MVGNSRDNLRKLPSQIATPPNQENIANIGCSVAILKCIFFMYQS